MRKIRFRAHQSGLSLPGSKNLVRLKTNTRTKKAQAPKQEKNKTRRKKSEQTGKQKREEKKRRREQWKEEEQRRRTEAQREKQRAEIGTGQRVRPIPTSLENRRILREEGRIFQKPDS